MSLVSSLYCDHFFEKAPSLRREFEDVFQDPREISSKRFVWDFWYQPEQYRHLRTPANAFFSKKLFKSFLTALTRFGQNRLGCSGLSQPWLSYYVDGCFQRLHGDVPHGPFAYVFSLTKNLRAFSGGKTLLLKDSVLNFWSGLDPTRGFESHEIFQTIANPFNRLVVFDPRIPHGVEEVRGVLNPLDSRVVIHGWFTEPMPFVEGGLSQSQAEALLNRELPPLVAQAPRGKISGLQTLKIRFSPGGQVMDIKTLVNTLRGWESKEKHEWQRSLGSIQTWRAPSAAKASTLVLPIFFKA